MLASVFSLLLDICLIHLMHIMQIAGWQFIRLAFRLCPVTFFQSWLFTVVWPCVSSLASSVKGHCWNSLRLWERQSGDLLKAVRGQLRRLGLMRLLNCSVTAALWAQPHCMLVNAGVLFLSFCLVLSTHDPWTVLFFPFLLLLFFLKSTD